MQTTPTAPADRLRSILRAAGISSRAVTVKSRPCSTEHSLTVTVRDASVPMEVLRRCVAEVEHVRRCDRVGDILGGGNTFVHVRWDDAVERPAREALTAEALEAHVDSDGVSTVRGYHFARNERAELTVWRDGKVITRAWGIDADAMRLVCVGVARDLLERGEGAALLAERAVAA